MLILFVAFVLVHNAVSTLPNGCTPLQDRPLDTADPGNIFGINHELRNKAPPQRTGNLRSQRPLPTHHFATNSIKGDPIPMVLFPYEAILVNGGIVYDAYTLDRWSDPDRSDMMLQQSATAAGQSWNKLWSLGTNMKQMTSGPDGNKGGIFTGKSGVRIGMDGISDAEMTDFGDLYANFEYQANGGSMEVPLVRGSALLTHIFKNADPVVKPFCLSNFNGQHVNFNCPKESSAMDGGSGHLSASCIGSTMTITLDSTKPIHDITKLQYAYSTLSAWRSGTHGMRNCNTQTCKLSNGDRRVTITVPSAHGRMAYAVNYIGYYIVPGNWIAQPEEVSCNGRRDSSEGEDAGKSLDKRYVCHPTTISLTGSCDGYGNIHLVLHLGASDIPIYKIQYAVEGSTVWHNPPAMVTCRSSRCQRIGQDVHIRLRTSSRHINIAINVIGCVVLPHTHWVSHPYTATCTGVLPHTHAPTQPPPVTHRPWTYAPHTYRPVTHAPHTYRPVTHAPQTHAPYVTHSPVTHAPHTQSPSHTGHGGSKFIMELNEPGNDLPGQTRKFLLYFSQPVIPHINSGDNTIKFSQIHGGRYNGIVQLAYLGAGPRGDKSHNDDLNEFLGVYSYKPSTAYCVSEATNKTFSSFDWNPNNQNAASGMGKLMMITIPHQEYILKNNFASHLRSTVYGFKGYVGSSWLMEMDMPRASMEPEQAAVDKIKANAHHLEDIRNAIKVDASETKLDQICGQVDSYGAGKEIGMVARLASISRAFGTNHYHQLDASIKNCLEKWLRVQDTLYEMWKIRYDTVWGGLFMRATNRRDLDFGADFGFTFYNDHHFHFGYFLYALAYYVRHDPTWAQQHKHRIYAMARDVGNLSYKDKHFPVARHKDIYTGFSWASGIAPGHRQEESSSESLNCYHGLAALGDALNDAQLRRTGQILLAMEIASVREYWHVRDHNYINFPPLIQDSGAVGMIGEDNFYAYTLNWPCDPNVFPQRHACLIGIQVIPITSVSKYWMDKDWAKHILKSCSEAITPSTARDYRLTSGSQDLASGWKAFCYAAMAPYDQAHATEAANYIKQQSPHSLVGGTSSSSTLLFIYGQT